MRFPARLACAVLVVGLASPASASLIPDPTIGVRGGGYGSTPMNSGAFVPLSPCYDAYLCETYDSYFFGDVVGLYFRLEGPDGQLVSNEAITLDQFSEWSGLERIGMYDVFLYPKIVIPVGEIQTQQVLDVPFTCSSTDGGGLLNCFHVFILPEVPPEEGESFKVSLRKFVYLDEAGNRIVVDNVAEPATFLMVAGGLATLLVRRRHRK